MEWCVFGVIFVMAPFIAKNNIWMLDTKTQAMILELHSSREDVSLFLKELTNLYKEMKKDIIQQVSLVSMKILVMICAKS